MVDTSLGFSIYSTYNSRGTDQAASALQRVSDVASATAKTAGAAMAVAAGAVAAYAASAIEAGLASNELQQRAGSALEIVLGSAQEATEQMAELRAFGSESPISMSLWIKAQQQMLAFGVEAEKVVPLLSAIQNTALAGGGTEEEILRIIEVMARMSSSAEVTKGDLNVLGTQGVAAAQLVGAAFGQTSAAITAQISAGTLAVEDFYDGFITGADEAFGGVSASVRQTFAGVMDRLRGVRRRIGEILAEPLIDPAGGGAFIEIGNAVADVLNRVEKAIKPIVQDMSEDLEPTIRKIAQNIRSLGDDITTENLEKFIETFGHLAPLASATSAALGVKFAADLAGGIPVIGNFVDAVSPLATGIAVLAATSPELRTAFTDIGRSAAPLVPVVTDLAVTTANVLNVALETAAPLISLVANNLEFIVPAAIAAAGGLTIYGIASANASGLSLTLALGLLKVRDAVAAITLALSTNPILLIATIVAAVATAVVAFDALNSQVESVADAANEAGGRALSNLSLVLEGTGEATTSAANDMRFLLDELDRTTNRIAEIDDNNFWEWLDTPIGERDTLTGDLAVIEGQIDSLDQALAAAVTSGTTAAEVMDILHNQYGLTRDEINQLMPELGAYQSALDTQRQTQNDLAEAVGGTVAALQTYAAEMRAQSDPAFAAIKAQQDLNEAVANFNEVSADSSSTQEDIAAAALDAAEAYLAWTGAASEGAQSITEGVDPALAAHLETLEGGEEILAALQEQYGITEGAINSTAETAVDAANNWLQSNYDLENGTIAALTRITDDTGAAVDGIISDYQSWTDKGYSTADALKTIADDYGLTVSQVADIVGIETEGMSAYIEDWVFSAKGQIDDLMLQGYSYAEALAQVAASSGMSTSSIESGFRDARAAGLEFSDDYPATIRVDGYWEAWNRINNLNNLINNIDRFVTISFDYEGYMPRGGIAVPYATGGLIRGPGTSTSDSVPVAASDGEYMIKAAAVDHYGVGFMNAINNMQAPTRADGGRVSLASVRARNISGISPALPPVNFIFNGPVASKRQAQDMVIEAIKDAQNSGRIPRIIPKR